MKANYEKARKAHEMTIICEEIGVLGDSRFQAVTVAVKKESPKAFQVVNVAEGSTEWLPKSQIEMVNGFAKIPQWLWDRKGFQWFAGPFSITAAKVNAGGAA